jgi:GTP-binding protein
MKIADLFLELAVDDSQLYYPVYYSISREGKAWKELPDNPAEHTDMSPIFNAIINDIPAPTVEPKWDFATTCHRFAIRFVCR